MPPLSRTFPVAPSHPQFCGPFSALLGLLFMPLSTLNNWDDTPLVPLLTWECLSALESFLACLCISNSLKFKSQFKFSSYMKSSITNSVENNPPSYGNSWHEHMVVHRMHACTPYQVGPGGGGSDEHVKGNNILRSCVTKWFPKYGGLRGCVFRFN